jgi:hypothetical protein
LLTALEHSTQNPRAMRAPDRRDGLLTRPDALRRTECRPYLRRQAPCIQPSPPHQRGSVRTSQRRRTATHVLRQDHSPQTQPRGGDQQINAAIHTTALSRSIHHPQTAPTCNAKSPKARPNEKPCDHPNDTSPTTPTTNSPKHP